MPRECGGHADGEPGAKFDRVPPPWVKPNTSATSALPVVWPSRRDVDSMPLPAPARSRGALAIISRLFGDWKNPKPMPHTASRQATSIRAGGSA